LLLLLLLLLLLVLLGVVSELQEWKAIEEIGKTKTGLRSGAPGADSFDRYTAMDDEPSGSFGGGEGRRDEETRRDVNAYIAEHGKELEQLELELAQFRTKMSLFNVNGHAIGFDRHKRRHWCFGEAAKPSGAARLFIEDPDQHTLFCLDTVQVRVNVVHC
jgi:hypothetical protein